MNYVADQIVLVGIATARIAAALLLVPLFAQDTIPAGVRNSILVSLGIVSLLLQPQVIPTGLGPGPLIALFAKEVFVGLTIGFFFGSVLWAIEAAGVIIDTKVGATMAQIVDPLSGHQTSLNGEFLARLANLVFLFSGGLSLFVGVLFESYALWPISADWPRLPPASELMFAAEFGRMMALATLFAAPILVILFVIDLGLGLVNRFAQQLNVFSLSMSIKAAASTFFLILFLPTVIHALLRDIASRPAILSSILKAWNGG